MLRSARGWTALVVATVLAIVLVCWWSRTARPAAWNVAEADVVLEGSTHDESGASALAEPAAAERREQSVPSEPTRPARLGVRIVVVDRHEQSPIPMASVVVFERGTRKAALRAGEDGSVLVEGTEWDDCLIEAQGPHHFGERLEPAKVRAQLAIGPEVRIELDRLGKLLVRVVDGDGQPIARAFVEALAENKEHPGSVVYPLPWPEFQTPGRQTVFEPNRNALASSTNQLGELELPVLPCDRPMIVRATLNVPEVSRRVTIPRNPGFLRVDLQVADSSEVVGTVQWDDGSPAVGVGMTCFVQQNSLSPFSATTDAHGAFRFARVRHGRTDFRPDLLGEEPRSIEVAGERTDVGVWTIAARAELSGQVLDRLRPYPEYHSHYSLALMTESARLPIPTTIDGAFKASVPRGRAVLSVSTTLGLEPLAQIHVDPPVANLSIDVTDRLGRVQLRPSSSSPGDVIEVGLRPLAAATAGARDCERKLHGVWATNDSEREIEQRVTLVRWADDRVVVTALGSGTYDAWIDAGERGSAWLSSIHVREGQTTDLGIIETGWSSLEVRTQDASGQTLGGREVAAVWNIGNGSVAERTMRGRTDEHGIWKLDQVSPGPWTVFLPDSGPCDPSAVTVIAELRRRAVVRLSSEASGSLRGRVLSASAPCAGAIVSLLRIELLNTNLPQLACDARTDESGSYDFESVTPGDYLARLRLADATPSVGKTITVRSGEETTLDFLVDEDLAEFRFLVEGELDRSIVSGTVWTESGWARLQPGPLLGTFVMPRVVGKCVFVLNRTGVPGAGYVGHARLSGYQQAVFAWNPPAVENQAIVFVDAPSAHRELVLCDANVASVSARVVRVHSFDPRSDLPFRIGVSAVRRPHGWVTYGLGLGLELEVLATDPNGAPSNSRVQTEF